MESASAVVSWRSINKPSKAQTRRLHRVHWPDDLHHPYAHVPKASREESIAELRSFLDGLVAATW